MNELPQAVIPQLFITVRHNSAAIQRNLYKFCLRLYRTCACLERWIVQGICSCRCYCYYWPFLLLNL